MANADPFEELRRLTLREMVRLDPALYGRCPTCALGPTSHEVLDPIAWFWCAPCRQGWFKKDVLDPPNLDDFDPDARAFVDEIIYGHLVELAECERHIPEETSAMPNRAPALATRSPIPPSRFVLADPFPDGVPNPSLAKWLTLTKDSRERNGAVCNYLAEVPPKSAPGPLMLIRAHFIKADSGISFGEWRSAVEGLYVADPVERAKWATAANELDTPAMQAWPPLLSRVIDELRAQGDLLTTLRYKRDALNVQIARLEDRRTRAQVTR